MCYYGVKREMYLQEPTLCLQTFCFLSSETLQHINNFKSFCFRTFFSFNNSDYQACERWLTLKSQSLRAWSGAVHQNLRLFGLRALRAFTISDYFGLEILQVFKISDYWISKCCWLSKSHIIWFQSVASLQNLRLLGFRALRAFKISDCWISERCEPLKSQIVGLPSIASR